MPPKQILVSLNVPILDDHKNLERLLSSLASQSFRDFEVNVVEAGDIEKTLLLLRKYTEILEIRVFKQGTSGLVNARNIAGNVSRGNLIVFLDADVEVNENWLQEIVYTFQSSPTIGGVCGPSIVPEELLAARDLTNYLVKENRTSLLEAVVRRVYFKFFLNGKPLRINKLCRSGALSIGCLSTQVIQQTECSVEVDFLDASNMAFRSAVFKGVGGFNEVFGGLGEYSEPELCIRVNSAGYRLVFNPKATVYHYPGRSKKHASPKCTYARGKNFAMFIRINPHCKLALSLIFYVIFFNAYHLSKGLTEKDPSWFNCIRGFVCGIRKKAPIMPIWEPERSPRPQSKGG